MNIQAQYENEMGTKATYRKGASDYHTLEYVRWLEHGASKTLTGLELLINEKVLTGLGWCYAYHCTLLDKGVDPRTEEVLKLIEAARRDGIIAGLPKEVDE
jgi:hypothetical protein